MPQTYKLNLQDIPVYIINLEQDTDKKEKILSVLTLAGFKNINWHPGVVAENKTVGVARSHNNLLKKLSNKDLPCLVLEDDVSIFDLKTTIEIPLDADAYYLGNSSWGLYGGAGKKKISVQKIDDNTYRIYNMLAAHAIVYLNKDYVRFLDQATSFNVSIKTNQDKARAETMKYWNIYSATRPMFYQNGRHEAATKIILPGERHSGPEGAFVY
jgi:hypothetical protein